MNFIPEQPEHKTSVPFFDDITSEDGWRGHTTGKTVDQLKSEIMTSITRLGGLVVGFQRGTFQIENQAREGFRIHYTMQQPDGGLWPGRLDVAALPVREDHRKQRSLKSRREKSLKMALYMLREALDGTWFLRQLSPGYAPLMPWMIEQGSGRTFTELWSDSVLNPQRQLPEPMGEATEAEFTVTAIRENISGTEDAWRTIEE